MTARVENVFDARALLVGWVLLFQELAESEHGVERRTQFMAHSREKFVLGTVRPVGFLLRQAQSILHFGARSNVMRHTEKHPISFRPIGRPYHSDDAAVFSHITIHDISDRFRSPYVGVGLRRFWSIIRMNQVDVWPSDELFRLVSPQTFRCRIDGEKPAIDRKRT